MRCTKQSGAENFDGPAKQCRSCDATHRLWECTPCGVEKEACEFDAENLNKHRKTSRDDKLVCHTCRKDGFTPKDTDTYPCELCSAKGHEAFEDKDLRAYKSAPAGKKKPKMYCAACKKTYEREAFITI